MKVVVNATVKHGDYTNHKKLEKTLVTTSKTCKERDLGCSKNARSNPPSC